MRSDREDRSVEAGEAAGGRGFAGRWLARARTHRRWLLAATIVVFVAVAAWLLLPDRVDTVTIERREVVETLVATGRVTTVSRSDVGSPIVGTVAEVTVAEGDRVSTGEVVVFLEDAELLSAVEEARASLAGAEAALRRLATVDAPTADAELLAAETDAAQARLEADRSRALFEAGGISRQEMERAERAAETAEARLVGIRATAGGLGGGGADREQAEAVVEQAREAFEAASARLEQTRIRAPDSGTVLRRDVEPGEAVQPGGVLLEIALDGPTELVVTPDERWLSRLRPGQRAVASADAYPHHQFPATVTRISPTIDPDQGTVEVRLTVPDAPSYLRVDMTVSVNIELIRLPDAPTLPVAVVRAPLTDSAHVLVARNGRADRVPVGVGVAVIVFVSALIEGLQDSLVERTLGTQAHVVVRPPEDMPRVLPVGGAGVVRGVFIQRPPQRMRSIDEWQQTIGLIERLPEVVAVAPTVSGSAIASRGGGTSSIAVRGIEPASFDRIVELQENIVEGALDLSGSGALIGIELASDLGIGVGDRIRLIAPEDRGGIHTINGVFDFGVRDLNERWVFVSLRSAQAMFALEGGVSTLEVLGTEIFGAERLARRISEQTGLLAESWMEINEQLLVALRSQSNSSFMIQGFVILAVALGIASVLAVTVVQKAREIGILRATGTSTRQVMRIFLLEGGILGLGGAVTGIALGIALALTFANFAENPDGSPTFPVALTPLLFARASLTAVVVGLVSAVLPARRAARLDPATAIRSG